MNKKQKNDTYAITLTAAARRLGVSVSTVQRLVRKGNLHATEPQLRRHHWTRGIRVDKAFEAEHARRMHGLKAPSRKAMPDTDSVQREFVRKAREERRNDMCKHLNMPPALDPSPIQTVTPPEDVLEKCRNAMNICLEAQKDCQESKEWISQSHAMTECWVNKWLLRLGCSEGVYTRCTATLAAACILQLLLAIYYTLCHFNII